MNYKSFPFKQFKIHYDERITIIARNLNKLRIKQTKLNAHINFLQVCKREDLISKDMIIRSNENIYQNHRLSNEFLV